MTLPASLKEYLNIRRSFGYKLNDDERCLKKFISFLIANDYPYITAQSAVKWAPPLTTISISGEGFLFFLKPVNLNTQVDHF